MEETSKKPQGRPKKRPEERKKAVTYKFTPELINAIESKTKGKNRTAAVEQCLEKEFLQG